MTKYRIWNHKAYLSILQDQHNMGFQFVYKAVHFLQFSKHSYRLILQSHPSTETHWHSTHKNIKYLEISMQNIQLMQTFQSHNNMYQYFPNIFLIENSISFLMTDYLLIEIAIVRKLHDDAEIILDLTIENQIR